MLCRITRTLQKYSDKELEIPCLHTIVRKQKLPKNLIVVILILLNMHTVLIVLRNRVSVHENSVL